MKASAIWAAASLLIAVAGVSGSSLAAERGTPVKPAAVLKVLAGSQLGTTALGQEHGRGIAVNLNGSALANGTSAGNAVIGSAITGMISNDHSIDNNTGFTSVLQNFGNNSVLQTSTTINISVH